MQSIDSFRDSPRQAERVGQIWPATPPSIFKAGPSAVLWGSIERKDRCSEMTSGRPACQARNKAPRMRPDPKIKKDSKLCSCLHYATYVPVPFPCPSSESSGCFPALSAPAPSSPKADDTNQPFPSARGFYIARGSIKEGTDFDSQGFILLQFPAGV